MDHLTDSQMLDLAQGAEAAPEITAHLGQCADCRQKMAALETVWGRLGAWRAPAMPADLRNRIMAALPEQSVAGRSHVWQRSLRVAAALVVAAGIGHVAGRAWGPGELPPVDEAAVTAALYLDDESTATTLLAALEAPEGVMP